MLMNMLAVDKDTRTNAKCTITVWWPIKFLINRNINYSLRVYLDATLDSVHIYTNTNFYVYRRGSSINQECLQSTFKAI